MALCLIGGEEIHNTVTLNLKTHIDVDSNEVTVTGTEGKGHYKILAGIVGFCFWAHGNRKKTGNQNNNNNNSNNNNNKNPDKCGVYVVDTKI